MYKIEVNLVRLGVILAINVILKLCNLIDWGWGLILWPVWAGLLIIAIIIIFLLW